MASGSTSWLRGFFTTNIAYKAVAFLLALLLWLDVTTDETAVIQYPVPLRIAVEGRDMIITNDVPSEVEVSFQGTGRELLRLNKEDLEIQKEVRGGEADTTYLTLNPQDVRRPADVAVTPVAVTPGRIPVVTDRFVERTVPLEPIGQPTVADDRQVVDVQVEPRRVKVRGVTAEVDAIGSLGLDLSQVEPDQVGAFDERMEIAVPESLRTVTVTPDSVRIRGRVVEVLPIPPDSGKQIGQGAP